MKYFLSSPSPSSASSKATTTHVDANPKNPLSGFIAGVFRWLFCFTTIPKDPHPHNLRGTENIKSSERVISTPTIKPEAKVEVSPGIVARLMGLESMPEIDLLVSGASKTCPNSIVKSRSMNSVDCMRNVNAAMIKTGRYLRVQSFREAPRYSELQDEHFYIFSFENDRRRREAGDHFIGSKRGKLVQPKSDLLKQRSAGKCKKKSSNTGAMLRDDEENKENRNVSEGSDKKQINPMGFQKFDGVLRDATSVLRPRKSSPQDIGNSAKIISTQSSHIVCRRTKNPQEKSNVVAEVPRNAAQKSGRRARQKQKICLPANNDAGTDCEKENSSPVSVLEFDEFGSDPNVPISDQEGSSRLTNANSRRKLSEKLESCTRTLPRKDNALISEDSRPKGKTMGTCITSSRWKGRNDQQMLGQVRRLVERDMKQDGWMYEDKQRLDYYGDLTMNFGLEILDKLLAEVVGHLLGDSIDVDLNHSAK